MQSANAHPTTTPRLLALSGIVFAVLFLIGWFASGALTPDYGAADEDWTNWADDNLEKPYQCVLDAACGLRVPPLRGDDP